MQLQIAAYDGDSLSLHAPLAANFNDKGCAFGGSLTSLMTLAGGAWSRCMYRRRTWRPTCRGR